jgi:hypothetical protein
MVLISNYMKNKITKQVLAFLCFIATLETIAQQPYFKIASSYRMRSEFRQGYRTLMIDSAKPAFFITQRARLTFDYNKDKIQFFASIQDARTWGDEEMRQDIGTLQVNELWTDLNIIKNWSIKLGRQELAYDDHRILGNLDWANLTISHDAVLLKYNNTEKGLKAHFGAAYNNVGEPLIHTPFILKNYNALGFIWIKKEILNKHNISFLSVINAKKNLLNTKKLTYATLTFGPLYNFNNNKTKAIFGAYYQLGKNENTQSVNAYMINAYGEHKLNKISLGLGIDYLSGDKKNVNSSTETQTFNTLYATNHKFYGYMDYFTAIPADTKNHGLIDLYFKTSAQLHQKLNINLDGHSFIFPKKTNNINAKSEHFAGIELDAIGEYKPSNLITLQLGYSAIFPTENMKTVKLGDIKHYNHWAFVMLKVSPTLLIHEFKSN